MEGDHNIQCGYSSNMHFNPRPPWGGRRKHHQSWNNAVGISIHTLRGEGDQMTPSLTRSASYFNPRPPWGGRLRREQLPHGNLYISIHALRGEGDDGCIQMNSVPGYFNPRPPWGGRLCPSNTSSVKTAFQSTPSVGRATGSR